MVVFLRDRLRHSSTNLEALPHQAVYLSKWGTTVTTTMSIRLLQHGTFSQYCHEQLLFLHSQCPLLISVNTILPFLWETGLPWLVCSGRASETAKHKTLPVVAMILICLQLPHPHPPFSTPEWPEEWTQCPHWAYQSPLYGFAKIYQPGSYLWYWWPFRFFLVWWFVFPILSQIHT